MNIHRFRDVRAASVPAGDGTLSVMPTGSTSSTWAIGSHSSGVSSGTTPVNDAGATPTIV